MKQTIEQRRTAERATRFAGMTERELTVELQQIAAELDDNRMDHRLKAHHFEIRDQIRAELAARRQDDLDDTDVLTDEQMEEMDQFYRDMNAAAADEVEHLARERARINARDVLIVVSADVEPF